MKKALMVVMMNSAWVLFGAQLIYMIEAPNGVGDVVSLTNVLANLPRENLQWYPNTEIWLKPEVYNLSGVYMNEGKLN